MFSAPQHRAQSNSRTDGIVPSGAYRHSKPSTNGNGVVPTGDGKAEYVVVLDGEQILLFRKVPISACWASDGKYPLRFESTPFDLIRVGPTNGQAVHAG